ncbi:hypothetical protein PO250_01085 [Limosilactobacillus mucosae]|uniref:Uncharacterized protein n=1 Tax=Limosilactobacillus mucosae TaxID=97478 RepID=A0AAJ1MAE7_LIMMU|nr:hypothetical protein [Limosilactobacillus mucosae]MDC2828929.1 hypothetical protein [Limosilactobacillus mucosae]
MTFSKDSSKLDNQEKAMEQVIKAIADLKRELNAPSREIRSWRMRYRNWHRKLVIMDNAERKAFFDKQIAVSTAISQANEGIRGLAVMQSSLSGSGDDYQAIYKEAEKLASKIASAHKQLNDYGIEEKRLGKQLKRFMANLDKWQRKCLRAVKANRELPAFPTVKFYELSNPKRSKVVIVSSDVKDKLDQLNTYATGPYANTIDHIDTVVSLAAIVGAPIPEKAHVSWKSARLNSRLDDAIKAAKDSHNAFGGQRNSNSGAKLIDRFVESVEDVEKATDLKSLERAERRFKAMQESMLNWWTSNWHERGGVPRNDTNKKHWKVPDWVEKE